MKHKTTALLTATLVVFGLLGAPSRSIAGESMQQEPRRPGFVHILGGILLTPPVFIGKLFTCVGTQVTAGVAYTATFGVEGNYDGGTNGREIGEVARRSCTGSWWVRPSQVVRDYGE
jgi:hypothetical protein